MAGFVPMKAERSWVPFGRPLPLPAPEPQPEPFHVEAPAPPDPLAGERQRMERLDHDRTHEHQRRLEALDQAVAAAKAEEVRFATLCGQMDTLRTRLLAELRAAAGELVVSTAARIAGDALRTEPELVEALIDEAVSALGEDGLVLRVCPMDEARLRLALGDRKIQVVGDPDVRAGCIASSPVGRIDATLDTAVAALRDAAAVWAR